MRLVVDLNDEVYNNMVVKNEYTDRDVIAVHNALIGAIRIPEGHGEADVVDTVKTVTNANEAEEYIISKDIIKGFEKFTEIMYKQGEEKRNEDSN